MARVSRPLLAVVSAALVIAGSAAAAGPAIRHTTAGTAAARASLITKSDLGSGWTATPTPSTGIQVICTGHVPSGTGIVETGAASSPSFAGGKLGPFIVQETSVYATQGEAGTWWKRAVTAGLVSCARQSLDTIRSKGIKVKLISQGPLTVQQVGPMTAGYRVVAALTSKTQKGLKTYVDWILVGSGKSLTEIMISSFQQVPAKYEYALALIAYHNMGGQISRSAGGSSGSKLPSA